MKMYKTEKGQFISDGYSLYPISHLPIFDEESFCVTYDIPKDKLNFSEEYITPSGIDISDSTDDEEVCEALTICISYHGRKLIPVITQTGIKFIDSNYLAPLADNDNMLSFWERYSPNGSSYFVIKSGMLFGAAVMPFDVLTHDFLLESEKLYKLCKKAYDNRKSVIINGQESMFDD